MNISKTLGAILILFSLYVGYIGVNKISDNTQQVNILGLKIDASNESGKQQGYMFVGFAIVLFAGGILIFNKSKSS